MLLPDHSKLTVDDLELNRFDKPIGLTVILQLNEAWFFGAHRLDVEFL